MRLAKFRIFLLQKFVATNFKKTIAMQIVLWYYNLTENNNYLHNRKKEVNNYDERISGNTY